MRRKLSWMLLALLVFWLACQDQPKVQKAVEVQTTVTVELKPQSAVAQPSEEEIVAVRTEELKTVRTKKITWKKDGSEMVLIPGGTFEMGDHFYEGGANERPVHTVTLDEFYMDVTEVTNAQYRVFMQQTGHRQPSHWTSSTYNQPDQPVVGVYWHDAMVYATWAGKRLPTEAEWEYAARGGLVGKRYPWGDEITHDDANYLGIGGKDKWSNAAPVGSFEANGYGLYDMAGNVWEWCLDEYDPGYYRKSPAVNPLSGHDRIIEASTNNFVVISRRWVLRGGNWDYGTYGLRLTYRSYYGPPNYGYLYYGFRCVSSGVMLRQ